MTKHCFVFFCTNSKDRGQKINKNGQDQKIEEKKQNKKIKIMNKILRSQDQTIENKRSSTIDDDQNLTSCNASYQPHCFAYNLRI